MANKIAYIQLVTSDNITPIQDWLDSHASATILSIDVHGIDVYVTYNE